MTPSPTGDRTYDVVLFGASGFVGRLTAAYLARHAPATLRVALAGRSAARLEAVRAGLEGQGTGWPVLTADSGDPASLAALAGCTRIVVTTVGPYLRHGLPLVAACAAAGTDYADLTGETVFVRRSIDAHHEQALRTGARIVHSCGFDSVPSDLAVLALHEAATADGAGDLEDVTLQVDTLRGAISGGTIDSLRTQLDATAADPALRRLLADPYALSPDRDAEPDLGDERDSVAVRRDPATGTWTGPFVMAPYNTRVVRRSNALQGWSYGRRFRYREVMAFGRSPIAPLLAAGATAGLGAVVAGMSFAPTRRLLDRFLPAPGEGPGEKTRAAGRFALQVRARTATGGRYRAVVAAQGDPGYQATSVMLGEAALALALDGDRLPARSGVLTPATALGPALADRLRRAGFDLTGERERSSGPRPAAP